ncbi:MAG TPA: 2-oxoacid:acceptor oxidoreductase family protein [Solirubrobacteraceae bacterium]|nr:2-oxoacid:acceptor oxidoreductase family protein [Solirubrobacteraceae bacterium]
MAPIGRAMTVHETRFHGRGGQGVVTAAELLAVAAFQEGRHAQAFPSFGSERTGAPVVSFCRIDDRPIRTREPISAPDVVIIVDPTLLHHVEVFSGLRPGSQVLVNSSRSAEELGLGDLCASHRVDRVQVVPATELARTYLGRPLPNAALLGALAAMTGIVAVASVAAAISQRFGGEVGQANVRAAYAAAELVPPSSGRVARVQPPRRPVPTSEVSHA